MEEIWKPIKGYGDKYQVSNQGHIRIILPEGMGDPVQQDKPATGNKRRSVDLFHIGIDEYKPHHIDEIVAEYFLDKPGANCRLIHINHDKSDDRAENLKWVSRDLDLRSVSSPRKNYRPVRQFTRGGDTVATYISISDAHRVTGISHLGIARCCSQTQNTAGGFCWEYISPDCEKPKPGACPICGSPVEIKGAFSELQSLLGDTGSDGFFIECTVCGLKSRVFKDETELVKYWNHRVK